MATECNIYDLGGVPIKHWKVDCNDEVLYVPIPVRVNWEKLFASFDSFVPRSDDVWLCGHPKSGNHWTYEIVQMLLRGEGKLYERMMERYFLEIKSDIQDFDKVESPRVFVTHLPYCRLPTEVKKKSKIIVVMRNPKSTAVSYYHHMRNAVHNNYKGKFEDFWPLYVNGITDGFIYKDWFSYNEEFWQASTVSTNVFVLFYEELVKEKKKCLKRLCDFFNIDRNSELIDKVNDLTQLPTLKESWKNKHPDDLKMTSKMDSSLIYRKGVIDDWKKHFSDEDNERFHKIYLDRMKSSELIKKIKFE